MSSTLRITIIAFLAALILLSCHKKKSDTISDPEIPAPIQDNSPFKCAALPPTPQVGWRDSTTNADHNINTYMFNPINPDEVIIVVNGDIFGFNKMYCYNIKQQSSTYLASLDRYAPSINKNGWIVYSTPDNNIYKIKSNGDSLTQLTFGNTTKDPKWDFNGNSIYYFQQAFNLTPAQLARITPKGASMSNMTTDMPNTAVFNKSNKVIYQKIKDNSVTLILKDMDSLREKTLITGPFDRNSNDIYFDRLCLDNTDENFYWCNKSGVFRCSIKLLVTDTVLKNCANLEYFNPIFQASHPNELLVACHVKVPLLPYTLIQQYKAVEYNLMSKEKVELKVFP